MATRAGAAATVVDEGDPGSAAVCIGKVYLYTRRLSDQQESMYTPCHTHHESAPMKARRQAAILDLVDRDALHSQEQLRQRLHRRGFSATQATISRDIKELGLVKRSGDGAYQRPGAETTDPETALTALERAANEFLRSVERVQQLVVIRTGRGQAQALAEALDRAP